MTDETRPENHTRIPEESPEELGNTIDGSGAGDGSTSRVEDEASAGADGGGTGGAAGGDGAARREEQKQVYQTPEQPDHAVGGSDGTADGQ